MHFLSFKLGEVTYVIDTTQMQEIIELQDISPVPNAPLFIDGVINLRGKIVPILNLSKRIGTPSAQITKRKILILKTGKTPTGIIVDSIERIHRQETIEIEDIPTIASTSANVDFIKGVIKKEDKILMLLDLEKVLGAEEKSILDLELKEDLALSVRPYDDATYLQVIGFTLSGLVHAIEMEKVQRIIRPPAITHLPSTPQFIKGVINLRGEVVIVIDIRSFLGIPLSEDTTSCRIIIIKINNKTCGVGVDSILQVVKIPQDIIQPPLSTLDYQSQDFIKGEFLHGDKLFTLLDLKKILSSKEIKKWQ